MPLIASTYQAPRGYANGYVQSIYPTLFRKIALPNLVRERIELADGDFLDLDWSRCKDTPAKSLVIVSHGLEGHSRRPYVLGVLRQANKEGMDALSWNFRSCSGEPNRLPRMYHSGATDDLHQVVNHALNSGYQRVHLVGFSMGGNLSLLYAGRDSRLPSQVRSVCGFSVPCDLRGSADQLAYRRNRIFMWRFLRDLRVKVEQKAKRFPELVSADGYSQIRNFRQFDDRYTAPLHGFNDALDYWQQSSCLQYLDKIRIPALLVNARNDPFLSADCYPHTMAEKHPYLHLEVPLSGGHVGFIERNPDHTYWMEKRALAFIKQQNE
ncbi:YheT family hydrolase [Bacterioplanoides sp. SCSIO 12839]|uniref:YheT family hydrolase n=1 Tax=Bacterioplanoides sp. SCSIO 12839 TaxID=2829569 RepID=UPI0021040C9E|nr:alpha/beta fold hydrolase [Bacterioplanoides sp. SCSIO 12839]UTW49430.1 alpha/beta fold hydrolase [Bacterioplanoides sp. SCSIO 12839]